MERNLRSNTEIYLIGFEKSQILGSKLPTNKEVLQLFFYHVRTQNTSIRQSATLATRACQLLEQEIGRTLLPFACRHHIFEIIVGKIVTTFLGPTNGPTFPIFNRFKKAWKTIDKTKYIPGMNDQKIKNALADVQDDLIIFCQNEMKKEIVRHDYQELLQLVLIFLGDYTKNVSFRELIAIHQARWMANLIYSIKMFLFRDQFEMTNKELQALRRIIVYTIRCHVKAWFQSTDVIKAPNTEP